MSLPIPAPSLSVRFVPLLKGPGIHAGAPRLPQTLSTTALRQVLDPRARAVRAAAARCRGHEDARLRRPPGVEEVPDLIQLVRLLAPDDGRRAVAPLQRGGDGRLRVRRARGGRDARGGEEGVRVQRLEEGDGLVHEVDDLLRRRVVVVALRVEAGDAGAVLSPLVLPEGLRRARVARPEGVHVVE